MLSCFCLTNSKSTFNAGDKDPSLQDEQGSHHRAAVNAAKPAARPALSSDDSSSSPKIHRGILRLKTAFQSRRRTSGAPASPDGAASAATASLQTPQSQVPSPHDRLQSPAGSASAPLMAATYPERPFSSTPSGDFPAAASPTALVTEGRASGPHHPDLREDRHSARSWARSSTRSSARKSELTLPNPHGLSEGTANANATAGTGTAGSERTSPARGAGLTPPLPACAAAQGSDGRASGGLLRATSAAAEAIDAAVPSAAAEAFGERRSGNRRPEPPVIVVPELLSSLQRPTVQLAALDDSMPTTATDDDEARLCSPSGAPRATGSRRAALLQAARSLQQQTSLRRTRAADPFGAPDRGELGAPLAAPGPANEEEGEEQEQEEVGAVSNRAPHRYWRPGASHRAADRPTGGGAEPRIGRAPVRGSSMRTPRGAAPPPPIVQQSSLRLFRQQTPLLIRRLRVTTAGSCSGSYGQLEFLDMAASGAVGPSGGAASCAATTGNAATGTNDDGHLCSPRGRTGSVADVTMTAGGSLAPPATHAARLVTQFESPGFLGTASPLEVSTGQTEQAAWRGTPPTGGRHARFVFADSRGGTVFSPRTTSPALLARQQTPCPLRWAALSPWWEDSGDALNEAAGRCWGPAAPTSTASEVEASTPDLAAGADGGGQVMLGMRPTEIGDGVGRGCAAAGLRPDSSTAGTRSRTAHGFSRLTSTGPYEPYGQSGQPLHTGPQPHPHLRSLRVQLSLSKLRRPSLSSVVSLVPPDGELSTGGSLSMAFRISNAGGSGGAGGAGSSRHGGGVVTPTRRGRRRNLAGNENLSWDLRCASPGVPAMGSAANLNGAAAEPLPGADSALAPQADSLPAGENSAANAASELPPSQHLHMDEARPPPRPPPLRRRLEGAAPAAPLQMRLPPQLQLQLRELANSLGESSLQQRSGPGLSDTTDSPPLQQAKPAPLSGQLVEADPVRAVWSRASSGCSGTACHTDGRSPSPAHLQLRRMPRLVSDRAEDGEHDFGSAGGSVAISPVARQGSGASRLGFPPHVLVAASADGGLAAGAARATKSSDGRGGLALPRSAVARSGLGAGVGAGRGGAQAGSCLAMQRPASVCDMVSLTPGSNTATAATGSTLAGRGGVPGGVQPRETRRVLYHTGSVRSHAPTEDDSAESLAKLGSEAGCGAGSEKALDFGLSTEDLGWGPRLVDPWCGQQPECEREGTVVEEGEMPVQKFVGEANGAQESPRWTRPGVQRMGGETGDACQTLVSAGGDSPKAAAMLAVGTGAIAPFGAYIAVNEHLKGVASMGAGGSSRLSRCT